MLMKFDQQNPDPIFIGKLPGRLVVRQRSTQTKIGEGIELTYCS